MTWVIFFINVPHKTAPHQQNTIKQPPLYIASKGASIPITLTIKFFKIHKTIVYVRVKGISVPNPTHNLRCWDIPRIEITVLII